MFGRIIETRRNFIRGAGLAGWGLLLPAWAVRPASDQEDRPENVEEEVSPAEDLMREHGVLKRVLLIYGEAIRRIETGEDLPPDAISGGANLIRRFIEDYHEKLEEDHLFPRFRNANTLVDLVNVLYEQHRRGRILTDRISRLAAPASMRSPDARKDLREAMRLFVRMYEPHEAREDTVLFPAFRRIVPPQEYASLGEEFEKKEHELFGEDGFERNVEEVSRLEKILGIYDLAQFTPSVSERGSVNDFSRESSSRAVQKP